MGFLVEQEILIFDFEDVGCIGIEFEVFGKLVLLVVVEDVEGLPEVFHDLSIILFRVVLGSFDSKKSGKGSALFSTAYPDCFTEVEIEQRTDFFESMEAILDHFRYFVFTGLNFLFVKLLIFDDIMSEYREHMDDAFECDFIFSIPDTFLFEDG